MADATKRFFKFTVGGQYIALHDAGAKTLRRYEATFTLPSQEAALSVICKHLLDDTLRLKYPDYIKFRTHAVISQEVVGRSPNREVLQMGIDEMGREQLSDFCILRGLMIDPYKHGDLAHTREVVSAQWRMKRLASKEKEDHKDAEANKEVDALRELNKLPKEEGTVVNINDQKARAAGSGGTRIPEPTTTPIPVEERPKWIPAEEDRDPLPPFVEDGDVNTSASSIIE